MGTSKNHALCFATITERINSYIGQPAERRQSNLEHFIT